MKQNETSTNSLGCKKTLQKFYCKNCNITCKNKYTFKRHLLTTKHKTKQYYIHGANTGMVCDSCKNCFNSRTTLWRHKKKCKIESKNNEGAPNETICFKNVSNVSNHFNTKKFTLDCNICQKSFNSRSTLWRHKKKCNLETPIEDEENNIQQKIYEELVKMNTKAAEQTVNQTINNNQKISINVFLDKYCGNAMNLKDFLDTLSVTLEDLDITHKLGYVDGMSSIFIKNLKDLPTVKRPIHCCDSKRGKFYIKDEDKWEKETGEKIEKVIDRLQIKHIKTIKEWEKANPNYLKDEKLLLKWNEMIHNIMGPYQTEERHKNKKIIVKNVGDKVSIKDAMKDIEK